MPASHAPLLLFTYPLWPLQAVARQGRRDRYWCVTAISFDCQLLINQTKYDMRLMLRGNESRLMLCSAIRPHRYMTTAWTSITCIAFPGTV